MTICIAAIYEKNKIIGITDKLMTIDPDNYSLKSDIVSNQKIYELTENAIIFVAGNIIYGYKIIQLAKKNIKENNITNIEKIAQIVNQALIEVQEMYRDDILKKEHLGELNWKDLHKKAGESAQYKDILNNFNEKKINIEFIVAGIDKGQTEKENEAKIYKISNLDICVCEQIVGYACIGLGSILAQASLLESKYHRNLTYSEGIYTVLKAKKKSETCTYVGKETDLIVLDKNINNKKRYEKREDNNFHFLKDESLKEIENIYENMEINAKKQTVNFIDAVFQ